MGGVDVSGLVSGKIDSMLDSLPYYFVLLFAAIPALTDESKKISIGWWIYCIFIIFFVGLRYQVGSDWYGYLETLDATRYKTFDELFEGAEIAFYFIVWVSAQLNLDVYGANMATTTIFCYGLFKYCEKQSNPWIAIFSAMPFLTIVIAMSANRQAAAIGVTLLALSNWSESKIYSKVLIILVATMFHTSAIVFLIFIAIESNIGFIFKIIFGAALLAAVSIYSDSDASISRYKSSYIEDADTNFSAGALQQIVINSWLGLVYILMPSSAKRNIMNGKIILFMSFFSLALIPFAFIYATAAARLSFYLFPVSISVLSTFPELSKNPSFIKTIKLLVVIYGFLILALWLNFANHAHYHLPYGNLLFN